MCGIAGVWYFDRTHTVSPELLRRMTDTIIHRGPDEEGLRILGNVGLGFRRLSIIDLEGSKQPMSNEDGQVWLVFNGEIYNFRELRPHLIDAGHRFHTQGDTEVIVHSYEQYGPACVDQLRGMFAFAIWDAPRQQMTLAVDPFGKKPLYYALDHDKLVFGSELKAIVQHPDIAREIDPYALDEYFTYGAISAPRTIFKSVQKVPPGCTVTIDAQGKPTVTQYWSPAFTRPAQLDRRPLPELAKDLRHLLIEAVKHRMISDVPLGAFLSGGVDSSVVVALMAQVSDQPVKTFAIGFEEDAFDETPYARKVATHCGTQHHEEIVRPDAESILPLLAHQYDEPFADSSAIPTYYVCRMARRHVTVALSGDGGDEIFGGYNSYRFAHLIRQYHRLPARVRDLITETADRMPAPVVSNNLKRRIRLLQMTPELQHTRASFFKEDERQRLFQPGVVPAHTGERLKRDALARMDGYDWLTQLQYVDLVGYMPIDILVKVDRASMLNSLEVRCPLLDRDIFEFMASVPPQYKFNGRRTKIILREAVKDLLPAEVFTRRKMGFGVPVGRWFRGPLRPLVEDMLLSDRAKARGLFNPDYARRIVSEHNEGIMDRVNPIWALLCFEMWAREYLDIPEAMPV